MDQTARERVAERLDANLRESLQAAGYDEALIDELVEFVEAEGARLNEAAIRDGRVQALRIQLRRTAGWRMPPNTVKVDRSTDYGNPYRVEKLGKARWTVTGTAPEIGGRVEFATKAEATAEAVRRFRLWLERSAGYSPAARFKARVVENLVGHNLACWCPEGSPCHADVLIEIAAQSRKVHHVP